MEEPTASNPATPARDPVCGMTVNPATAKHSYEHAGKPYYFCCGHCVEKFKSNPEAYLNKPATGLVTLGMPSAPKPAITADMVRDPVCGMSVNPASAKFVTDREGKKYYFCSHGCLEKFQADPAKYVNKPTSAVTPSAKSGSPKPEAGSPTSYVCPMCPEVRETKPVPCPSCGMALEPENPLPVTRTEYTCPMHPEIVRTERGSCPICGMALEPPKATATQEKNPELRDMTLRFWIGVILTAPLLAIAMGSMVWSQAFMEILHGSRLPWFELVLSTPV